MMRICGRDLRLGDTVKHMPGHAYHATLLVHAEVSAEVSGSVPAQVKMRNTSMVLQKSLTCSLTPMVRCNRTEAGKCGRADMAMMNMGPNSSGLLDLQCKP